MTHTISKRLRDETAAEHRQLEDDLKIEEWFGSAPQYRRLLEMFYGIVVPLEKALALHPWRKWGLDFETRRKEALLLEDLQQLGSSEETLPVCTAIPPLSTFARAWGALYVLEGSTLGGQQIRKIAMQHGTPESQLNYFTGYGGDTRSRWVEFGERIEHFAETNGDADEIIAGARDTFRAFHQWASEFLLGLGRSVGERSMA